MKRLLPITLSLAAASIFAGAANGQTVIHIAGSTAFRTSTHAAIIDILNNCTAARDSGSGKLYNCSAAIFHGNLKNGGAEVYIKTFWTGSAAGVYDVCNQTQIAKWIATPATVGGVIPGTAVSLTATSHDPTGANNTGGAAAVSGYNTETAPPEVAMSDSDQGSVQLSVATATGGAAFANIIKNNPLADGGANAGPAGTVGIVPFIWTASSNAPFSNITQQAAAALIKQAAAPVAAFDTSDPNGGNFTDWGFFVNRNEDSGTRIAALAEAQTGFGQSAKSYRFTFTNNQTSYVDSTNANTTINTGGTGSTLSGGALWPANWLVNTISTMKWPAAGHAGYIGGGDVANVLRTAAPTASPLPSFTGPPAGFTNGTSKAYLVGHLGAADQNNSVGKRLTYNNVPYSVANVQRGSYTDWTFEHLYYRTTAPTPNATQQQAADDIADAIFGNGTVADAPTNSNGKTDNSGATVDVAGILYDSSVKVTKSSAEGSYQIPNGN